MVKCFMSLFGLELSPLGRWDSFYLSVVEIVEYSWWVEARRSQK